MEEEIPDIFEEDLQWIEEWEEGDTGAWDDNKQHTEQSI